MKNRRFTALYQLGSGLLGVVFNVYLLLLALNANQGTQTFLAICFFIAFSACVFLAGLARQKHWPGSLLFSLLVQAVQVVSLHLSDLHLHMRCGISADVKYAQGTYTVAWGLPDFSSALTWKMVPDSYGINLFALVVCLLLWVESGPEKASSTQVQQTN